MMLQICFIVHHPTLPTLHTFPLGSFHSPTLPLWSAPLPSKPPSAPTRSPTCRSGSWSGGEGAWVELSGKMVVLARLLSHLRRFTDDRIVLVSNYTQVHVMREGAPCEGIAFGRRMHDRG